MPKKQKKAVSKPNTADLLPFSLNQWDGDESLLAPLSAIRSETTLSKLPIHNIAKKGSVNIQIKKTDRKGALELRWVTKYGQAGQPGPLAYKLDTLIINRRIDEQRHRLERTIALGSLYQICQELGKGTSGKDMNDIKNALEQNAFVGIDAFVKYEDRNGEKRTLEAKFTRYDVVMKGGELADGTKADCVYIILSDPYFKILTQSPTRPLDYDYLKTLTPGAQRFYEMLSYKIYRALMSREPFARLVYSEYCTNAPQKRYTAQSKVEAQMEALHKPHFESGYITGVSYHKIKDEDYNPDWELRYEIGPRAIAFHKAFNRNYRELSAPDKPKKNDTTSAEKGRADVLDTETAKAVELIQYFHERVRGINQYPNASAKELQQARGLIQRHGFDVAREIIVFAAISAEKTNFLMQSLGAVLQYEPLAEQLLAQKAQQISAYQEYAAKVAREQQAEMDAHEKVGSIFVALPEGEQQARLEVKMAELLKTLPISKEWEREVLLETARAAVLRDIMDTLLI